MSLFSETIKPCPTLASIGRIIAAGLGLFLVLSSQTLAQDSRNRYDSERDEEPEYRITQCQRLEQQLANDYIRNNSGGNLIPEITEKIIREGKKYRKLKRTAERKRCYKSGFLFGRTLRRTRRCLSLDRRIRQSKENLLRLNDDRDRLRNPRSRSSRREALLNELARNRCGKRYEQRRGNNFGDALFGDGGLFGGFSRQRRPRDMTPDEIQPHVTYRTMCVRLCDGFYFPVSFSALPSKFGQDSTACQDRCAAPSQLFVYRNPGAEIEQMISPDDGMPYSKLPNAWKYRKSFVKGCSCKQVEYDPDTVNGTKAAGNTTSKRNSTSFETRVESTPVEKLENNTSTSRN